MERRLAVLLRYCAIEHPGIAEVDAAAGPADLERVSGATDKSRQEDRGDERFIRHVFSKLRADRVLVRDLQDETRIKIARDPVRNARSKKPDIPD